MDDRVSALEREGQVKRGRLTAWALRRVFASIGERTRLAFRVEFTDGTAYRNRLGAAVMTLRYRTRAAERATLLQGHVGMIESYFDGGLDVDGDLAQAFAVGFESGFTKSSPFDERFRRTWRTYLVSCAEMFRSPHSNTHLFRVTFSKGNVDPSNYPMTRRHLYSA
jgi:hypothetical protein